MFSYFSEIFDTIITEFSLGTSASFALGLAVFLVGMLALREVMSWFLKTNHIHAEILSLRDQIVSLEARLEKGVVNEETEIEGNKKGSDYPEPLKNQFEKEIVESPKEQFPLQ